ncbi:MAG: glycosyltransferase family 2 protein [Butyrivibrio sp.]|nr:glycosyltransferase family 2 protein [Acetatifactor muris]MCM1559256.1 glycosyltransferase family 2 protein [Butyrivibrio sp.]
MGDKTQKKLLIIIPAYNEEKNIGDTLETLEAAGIPAWADILVMNDASGDRTAEIVKQKNYPVVTHVYNLGYGSGLQVGYKYAVSRGYEYVIQMDADGQHAVSNIKKIYDRLLAEDAEGKQPDIVLGSRFVEGSETYPISLVKRIAYSFFRLLIRLGTGRRIKDPTTGLQGLSRRAFSYYAEFRHFDDQYPDANMIMQMLLLGYQVEEMPALMFARHEGVSMHHGIIKPLIYMFRMMYSIIAVWMRIRLFKQV